MQAEGWKSYVSHTGVPSFFLTLHRMGLSVIFMQPCVKVDEDAIFSHTSDKVR